MLINFRLRRDTMTTLTKVGHTIQNVYQEFKEKYCPDDQMCNDIASLGGLAFMVWFMYIAMQPIM